MFAEYDTNEDDCLEPDEFEQYLTDYTGEEVSFDKLEEFGQMADLDGTGCIDRNELYYFSEEHRLLNNKTVLSRSAKDASLKQQVAVAF